MCRFLMALPCPRDIYMRSRTGLSYWGSQGDYSVYGCIGLSQLGGDGPIVLADGHR